MPILFVENDLNFPVVLQIIILFVKQKPGYILFLNNKLIALTVIAIILLSCILY